MSSKKSKQNDENLCPIASKRTKLTTNSPLKSNASQASWVSAKVESTSSPTGLTNEYLEEMGVVLLDSEESSSSASSIINFSAALTSSVSSNADENCNEATPNLAAPKFHHQQRQSAYDSLDQSADNSLEASITFTESNDLHCGDNNNHTVNNLPFEILSDESSLPERKISIQHKSVTTLAVSPSGRKRSPLSIVSCNSSVNHSHSEHTIVQPVLQSQYQQQSPNQLPSNSTRRQAHNTTATNNNSSIAAAFKEGHSKGNQELNYSPSQPSTSQQAALYKQQQQLHQLQTQRNQLQECYQRQQHQIQHHLQGQSSSDFFLFRRQNQYRANNCNAIDYFSLLSDEIVLQIFKWLPKKTLLRCGLVCRRFQQCASDESLWARLDMGGRSLRPEVMANILTRGVVILRLAQANLREPVFRSSTPDLDLTFQSKLQYLDLSLSQIDKPSLKVLLSHCRQLKKLSLEHVPLNKEICNEIAENKNLEALNLAMCTGLEAWSVRKMLEPLKNLTSLNISWTNLSVDAVTALVTHTTPNIMRLNIAGCRKTMFDSHIASLAKRCPQLIELDLSDCTGLTGSVITILCGFKMLEYLSLSRCYLIPAMSYLELKNLSTLAYLDVFGTLSDAAMDLLERDFPGLGINKFVHSSVARPTVGSRRTSIWGLRTRD